MRKVFTYIATTLVITVILCPAKMRRLADAGEDEPSSGIISVQVTDSKGKPIKDARVVGFNISEYVDTTPLTTDDKGRVSLVASALDILYLNISKEGVGNVLRRIVVPAEVRVEIKPGATISGTVTECGVEKPLTKFKVVASRHPYPISAYNWLDGQYGMPFPEESLLPAEIRGLTIADVDSKDGSYRITGLLPGIYEVTVYADGLEGNMETVVVASLGQEKAGVDFRMEKDSIYRGVLRDHSTGEALAGAEITPVVYVDNGCVVLKEQSVTTGDDGRFEVQSNGYTYPKVLVRHSVYNEDCQYIWENRGQGDSIYVGVEYDTRVVGRAFASDGTPYRSRKVALVSCYGHAYNRYITTTDAEGDYIFEGFIPGEYLACRVPDIIGTALTINGEVTFQDKDVLDVNGGETHVWDIGSYGATCEGSVYLNGKPLVGAIVGAEEKIKGSHSVTMERFAVSDDSGRYRIEGLGPWPYRVAVYSDIYHGPRFGAEKIYFKENADVKHDIQVKGTRISGVALAPDGKPIVLIEKESIHWAYKAMLRGEKGNYEADISLAAAYSFDYIPPGEYTLIAYISGYDIDPIKINVKEGQLELRVNIRTGYEESAFRGTVVDKLTGKPIGGAYVEVGWSVGLTAADGTIELHVPWEWFTIEVRKSGYIGYRSTDDIEFEIGKTVERKIELEKVKLRKIVLTGIIQHDGKPLAGIPYSISGDGMKAYGLADENGRYTVMVAPGGYFVDAYPDDPGLQRGRSTVGVEGEDGDTVEHDVNVYAYYGDSSQGFLEGVILDETTSKPLPPEAECTIYSVHRAGDGSYSTRPGLDGAYSLKIGKYMNDVYVSAKGYDTARRYGVGGSRDSEPSELNIKLKPIALDGLIALELVIKDSGKTYAGPCEVYFADERMLQPVVTELIESGEIELEVPTGEVAIWVNVPGYDTSVERAFVSGERTTVEMALVK